MENPKSLPRLEGSKRNIFEALSFRSRYLEERKNETS